MNPLKRLAFRIAKERKRALKNAFVSKIAGSRLDKTTYYHGSGNADFAPLRGQPRPGSLSNLGTHFSTEEKTARYYAVRGGQSGVVHVGNLRFESPLDLGNLTETSRLKMIRGLRITKGILDKWAKRKGTQSRVAKSMAKHAGDAAREWAGPMGADLVKRNELYDTRRAVERSLGILPRGTLRRAGFDAVMVRGEEGEIAIPHLGKRTARRFRPLKDPKTGRPIIYPVHPWDL